MTQRASWMERSASSITNLLEPRTMMLTVLPGLAQPVIYTHTVKKWQCDDTVNRLSTSSPFKTLHLDYIYYKASSCAVLRSACLTLTSLPEPFRLTSSASSAKPNISGVNWSMWAMGLVPMVWNVMTQRFGVISSRYKMTQIKQRYRLRNKARLTGTNIP